MLGLGDTFILVGHFTTHLHVYVYVYVYQDSLVEIYYSMA